MRRQSGYYGGGGYANNAAAQMQQSGKSGYYQGRHQEQQSQQDGGKTNHQFQWESDALQPGLPQTAMSPTAPASYSDGQGLEAPRSYYVDQRLESRITSEGQGGGDPRSRTHEQDMDIGYEDNRTPQTFEGLEKRIYDDVMSLWEEKNNAEDAENSRHRERMNTINLQYEEQLAALRARHASQREEFLHRESQARKEQYQKVLMEQYPTNSGGGGNTGPDNRDYNAAPPPELNRAYNSNNYESYRERSRFSGSNRDPGYDPKASYPRGRAYDSDSRYYN